MMNKFIVGDCNQEMMKLEAESVDIIISSPPYGDCRKYNGFVFDFEQTAYNMKRILKQGGVICWIVGDQTINGCETLESFKQAIFFKEALGLNIVDTMLYVKKSYLPQNARRYEQAFEYVFVISKGKHTTFNPLTTPRLYIDKTRTVRPAHRSKTEEHTERKEGIVSQNPDVRRTNVWTYSNAMNNGTKDKIAYKHPAIMPEQLAEDLILSFSNPGDLVVDPLVGSGTVCKMAAKNNRNWIGIDVSEEYIKIAEERMRILNV